MSARRQAQQAETQARAVGVRAASMAQPVRTLSGGNQQKVALARLLHQDADVLLLDEPTRGVDIGSKAQIYEAIAAAAARGKAVLFVSSYLPELLGLCDRLAVMSRGRLGDARPVGRLDARGRDGSGDRRMKRSTRALLLRFGPFVGLLAVILVFAVATGAPERYLSANNLRVVLAQTVIVALGAIGMTLIIVSGGIDLSVGSTIALTGVIAALHLRSGGAPLAACAPSVLAGGLIGLVNALVITRLTWCPSSPPSGMLGVARGVAKWLADQQTVNVPATWVNDLAVTFPTPEWLIFAPGVWLTVALAVVMAFVLRDTVFGRRVFALGSNEAAARACGIAVDAAEARRLLPGRPLLRPRRRDADVAAPPGRSHGGRSAPSST